LVSPKKYSARKKTHANKPQLEATLTKDDICLVRGAMEDTSEDMLQRYGEKQEDLYGRIETELKEVQQVVRLVRAVPTVPFAPSLSHTAELGDEPTQLRRLEDATKARFQRSQEEKEKDIEALKKEKDEVLVQLRAAQDSVISRESEKAELQEEKSQLQREKEKLLAEQVVVKEAVSKACHYVLGLAHEEKESVEVQIMKLAETLQQL
jgi:hypothetical protein